MKKFYRTALFAGVVAFGVAACGDDVQVVESDPPPPPALNVSLTPQAQTVATGDEAVFAVGISGGAEGAETTVTCASSNTDVASVSSSDSGCTVTGESAGQASITVTVTKGNQTSNAGAQVTVVEDTVTQATVSVASLTQGGTTAPIDDIAGQLDVTMNVNPNDETLQELRLKVDGEMVASQVFTQAMLEELAAEAEETAEAQQQITLSFNTARYDVDSTAYTAAPRYENGERIISASLLVTERPAEPTASNEIAVEFNNDDGFHVWAENFRDQDNEMDGQGQLWYGGPDFELLVRPIPVLFSGRDLAEVNMTLAADTASCGTLNDDESPFYVTFTCQGVEEGGFLPTITSQFADTGDDGPEGSVAEGILNVDRSADHPFPMRIDTQAPTGGSIQIVSDNGNRENWVNAEYNFAAGETAPTDGGVGGVETEIEILDGGEVISEDDLENSVTNTRYSLRLQAQDALGNSTTISQTASGTSSSGPAANSHTLTTFGFDNDAPEMDVSFPWADVDAASGSQFVVQEFPVNAGVDVEVVDGVSGFAPPSTGESLRHNLIQVTPVAHSPEGFNRTIIVGTASVASTTPFATTEAETSFVAGGAGITGYDRTPTSLVWDFEFDGIAADVEPAGYYIYQVRGQDKAGNMTDFGWFMAYVNEESDPELTGLSPASFYAAGEPATFEAVAQDPVEVTEASLDLRYAEVGRLVFDRNPVEPIGEKFVDFLEIPNQFEYALDAFIPGIQLTDEFGRPEGASNAPNQVTGRVYNGFASYDGNPDATHMMDDVTGDGVSEFFSVPLLSSTLEEGSTFPAGSTSADGSQVIGPTNVNDGAPDSDSGSFGFIVPDDGEVLVRGVTAQFTNPFEAVLVVARFEGETTDLEDDFLVIVDTAEPEFDGAFPTRDNGVIRDYTWTFDSGDFADQDGFLGFHAVGVDSGWSALATPLFDPNEDDPVVVDPNGAGQ